MENTDRELLLNLTNSNYTLRRLYHEHLELEHKLESLRSSTAALLNASAEEKALKWRKLRGMDRIMSILKEHKAASRN
ncbi:hypothetical protein JNK13_02620 [bacterium]|nr:hypothetical protein [bacterium]